MIRGERKKKGDPLDVRHPQKEGKKGEEERPPRLREKKDRKIVVKKKKKPCRP